MFNYYTNDKHVDTLFKNEERLLVEFKLQGIIVLYNSLKRKERKWLRDTKTKYSSLSIL